MVIKGKLITCKRQVKEFKGKETKEKLYVTLAEVKLNDSKQKELQEAFKDAGKNFTPAWVKKFEGYVNLATEYDLPCRAACLQAALQRVISPDRSNDKNYRY